MAPAATGSFALSGDVEPAEFGRYQVVASIGRGGMGEVYLARRRDKPRTPLVAIKVLIVEEGGDDDLVAMFMDEAAIMSQIQHPNVLQVLDFGRDGDRYFLAMEYLAGRPLVRVMIDGYAKEQGFDVGLIAAIGAQAARGLDAAHSATGKSGQPLQVVHRDVSPQNLFVTYQGHTKILDFGVARATERLAQTTAGQLKGKAAYMSPEQVHGMLVDRRSDVFSLGICLWEMTAGRRLFKRNTEWETITAVSSGPILPPSAVRGEPSSGLDAIILRALERDPKRRFQTAAEIAAKLDAFARSKLGVDGAQAVAALMKRLYGAEAAEEQRLVAELAARPPNASDLDTLRRLSGISPRPGQLREITLASAPESLRDLDHFGEDDTSPRLRQPMDETSEAATELDDGESSGRTGPEAVQRAVAALAKEKAVRASRAPGRPVRKVRRARRRVLPIVALGLIGLLSVATVVVVVLRPPVAPPKLALPVPVAIEEELDLSGALRIDPIEVAVPEEAGQALRAVVGELESRGLTVMLKVDGAILGGEDGVTSRIALDAQVAPVSEGAIGYLFTSRRTGTPAVTWAGGVGSAPWRVRALSINDCPAAARAQPAGVEVDYGRHRVVLPYLGPLLATTLAPPAFADRLEIEPLGIALGTERADRSAKRCASGWGIDGVRLERVPPGTYSLVWMGADRQKTDTLTLPSPTARPGPRPPTR